MRIERSDLERLVPRPSSAARAQIWDGYLVAICGAADLLEAFGITSNLRWAHLIATWCGETGLAIQWEDMSYSSQRIVQVFGRDKGVTAAEAQRLAHNPYALAERVYGLGCPRMAQMLGNTQAGDGYTFRGCGIGQITGREAHERYAGRVGCAVEDLCQPRNAVHAALLEWREKGCNAKADRDDVVAVRRAINGGSNGLQDVRVYLARAKRIWAGGALGMPAGVLFALGSEGAGVRDLQERLTVAGFASGDPDGKFGALTERAVAAFQVAHALTGTGQVDAATKAEIVAAPPAIALPGRAEITGDTLVERGSQTITSARRVGLVGKVMTWLGLGEAVDQATGFGALDAALSQAEHVSGLVERSHHLFGRASTLLGALINPRLLAVLAVIALGALLWRTGRGIEWRRVVAAKLLHVGG